MDFQSAYQALQPAVELGKEAAECVVIGGLASLVAITAQTVRLRHDPGSSFGQQARNPLNYAIGAAGGALTLLGDVTPDAAERAMRYAGVALEAGMAGGILRTVWNTVRTEDGVLDQQPGRFMTGAIRAAAVLTPLYGALEYLATR